MDRQILHDRDNVSAVADFDFAQRGEILISVVWKADPHVLTASSDGTLTIFDSGGRRCFTKGPFQDLVGFASARTYYLWLASCQDGLVHVFDGDEHLCSFSGSPRRAQNVVFSPDGTVVLTPAGSCTVKSFDARSGQCLATYDSFESQVSSATFSPDGSGILCTTVRGFAAVCAAASDKRVHMSHAGKWSRCAHFISEGSAILAVLRDGTARIFDAGSGCVTLHLRENGVVCDAAVSKDKSKATLVSSDCTARIYSLTEPRIACSVLVRQLGDYIPPQPVSFSADGTRILFALDCCHVRVLDASTGEFLSLCEGGMQHITAACFSGDGQFVLVSYYRSTVKVFDATTGSCVRQLDGSPHAFLLADFAWDLPAHLSSSRKLCLSFACTSTDCLNNLS